MPKNIKTKTPNKFVHQSSFCVFKNLFNSFPLLAAIHLFISSHNEIKDFCSMDKKTGRRYVRRVEFYTIHKRTKKEPAIPILISSHCYLRGIFDEKRLISCFQTNSTSVNTFICEDILMRCAVNSIFNCADVWEAFIIFYSK